jgi:hypothetical protein
VGVRLHDGPRWAWDRESADAITVRKDRGAGYWVCPRIGGNVWTGRCRTESRAHTYSPRRHGVANTNRLPDALCTHRGHQVRRTTRFFPRRIRRTLCLLRRTFYGCEAPSRNRGDAGRGASDGVPSGVSDDETVAAIIGTRIPTAFSLVATPGSMPLRSRMGYDIIFSERRSRLCRCRARRTPRRRCVRGLLLERTASGRPRHDERARIATMLPTGRLRRAEAWFFAMQILVWKSGRQR